MNGNEQTPDVKVELTPGWGDDVQILKVSGPLTIRNFFKFQELARQKDSRTLIVDLTEVPFIDSAALGSLVGIHISCDKDGRKYAIAGVNSRIRTVFEVSHVDQFLVTYPTVAEAEAEIGRR